MRLQLITLSLLYLDKSCGFKAVLHRTTPISYGLAPLRDNAKDVDELDSLRLDISSLDSSEQERLRMIQRLTAEADDIAKKAFNLSSDDDMEQRAITDTNWSGQSDVERTVVSDNSWNDLTGRVGLAFGDFMALMAFAAIGRNNHDEGNVF